MSSSAFKITHHVKHNKINTERGMVGKQNKWRRKRFTGAEAQSHSGRTEPLDANPLRIDHKSEIIN